MKCQGTGCDKVMTATGKTYGLRCFPCQRQYFLDLWNGAPEGSSKRDRIAKLGKMMKESEDV